ncbi:MarR family winged helix-turn-helix transcriptional regulator [Pararhodobacter sp. SW119]|uniref:MarR family winged helix-turn-helix transcriptional regulator n=1 Tax=Pararhodobacter sp. SW119 TaxID=2780075 RepID=UPI001AE0431C|nr:MarR family winged helix-turn-helix transcriptional regulator [Pararhodobacter sp. SW119]
MDHLDAARLLAAECLCFRSRRTARAITRLYDAALRPTGLQATQLTLLGAIALGDDGAQPMGRLSDILALEISTLTRNLRAIEAAGLVTIGRSPTDRRVRVARLTDAGRTRLETALPHWNRAHEALLRTLGEAGAEDLHKALDTASRALGAAPGALPPADPA